MHMTDAAEVHPVIGLETQRCEALVRRDWNRIGELLAPQLVYVHSHGIVHDRDQLLRFLKEAVRFSHVDRHGLTIQGTENGVTWTTGEMRLKGHMLTSGEPIASTTFVSQLWVLSQTGWQLALFHSTRIAELP